MTWQQLGIRSRAMHRCQGAGQLGADPGPAEGRFRLARRGAGGRGARGRHPGRRRHDARGPAAPRARRRRRARPALAALGGTLAAARAAFDPASPEAAVPALAAALVGRSRARAPSSARSSPTPARAPRSTGASGTRRRDVEAALALAHGLVLEARADDGLVTPGQSLGVAVALFNNAARGARRRRRSSSRRPRAGASSGGTARRERSPGGALAPRPLHASPSARDARPSQPYWRRLPDRDRHELARPRGRDAARGARRPSWRARASASTGVATTVSVPVAWRYEGPFVGGERRHELQVVPELSVRLTPEIAAIPLAGAAAAARGPRLRCAASRRPRPRPTCGSRRRRASRSTRRRAPLRFARRGRGGGGPLPRDAARRRCAPGTLTLRAVATRDGREYRDDGPGRRLRPRRAPPAAAPGRDARARARRAHGAGRLGRLRDGLGRRARERHPAAGRAAHAAHRGRSRSSPTSTRFTTIVDRHPRLRDARPTCARRTGGCCAGSRRAATSSCSTTAPPSTGWPRRRPPRPTAPRAPTRPIPPSVTSERISDETAPMTRARPRAPAAHHAEPHRRRPTGPAGCRSAGSSSWRASDPRYVELLAATDPFPYNAGEKRGLLVEAKVGQGTWTYVGLALFRQVPAGVPGGWRLLANLVSRRAGGSGRRAGVRPPGAGRARPSEVEPGGADG